jgi:hypothetical protein
MALSINNMLRIPSRVLVLLVLWRLPLFKGIRFTPVLCRAVAYEYNFVLLLLWSRVTMPVI